MSATQSTNGSRIKLGVSLRNLNASQLTYYVTRNLNTASKLNMVDDCIIFFDQVSPSPFKTLFSTMNGSELWDFDGTLITTDISTTLSAQKAVNSARTFFYVWDLEWSRRNRSQGDYDYNIKAFTDENIELIARSKSHATAISNFCNRKVKHIVDDFDINQLMKVINNE
jgi:hypothetical protein